MSINQRIRELRKDLGLNQTDFGARIGLKNGAISKIEQDGNTVVEQNKRIICDKFHVSMHWLETGNGDMYAPDAPADIFDSMRDELKLSVVEEKILRKYFELGTESRQAVTDFIVSIGTEIQSAAAAPNPIDPIQQELDDYKKELLARREAALASATGEESTKNRA